MNIENPEVRLICLGKSKRANFAVYDGIAYCSVKQLWRLDGVALAVSYAEGIIPSISVGSRKFVSIPWVCGLTLKKRTRSILVEMETAVRRTMREQGRLL